MNRQLILTVMLVLLAGVAAYMYQGMIMKYAGPVLKPAMEMVGMGGVMKSGDAGPGDAAPKKAPSKQKKPPASELVRRAYGNFSHTVRRTLNLPVSDTSTQPAPKGVGFEGTLTIEVPEAVGSGLRWSSLNAGFSLRSMANGTAKGSLRVKNVEQFPLPAMKFRRNKAGFQLIFPKSNEYYATGSDSPVTRGTVSGISASNLVRLRGARQTTASGTVSRTTWDGRDVFSVKLDRAGQSPATLYTTTTRPFSILGIKSSGSRARTVSITYRGDSREMLSRVRTKIPGKGTGEFQFRYADDRLATIRYTPVNTDQFEGMKLSVNHGDPYSNGAVISLKYPGNQEPFQYGSLEWSVGDGTLERVAANIRVPVKKDTATLSLSVKNIRWFDRARPVDLADTEGMTRLSRAELTKKFMPVMMTAMSAMNSNKTQPEASDTEAPSRSTKPTRTASNKQARSQPSRSAESAPAAKTGTESTPKKEPESQPSSQPEPTTKSEPTGRKAGGGVKAPAESGESIHYSSIGRFPMSSPPPDYKRARQAYGNGDFAKAQKVLTPLVEKYPKSANANFLLGMIHFEQGHFETARTYFKKASNLEHAPQIKVWSEQYLERIDGKITTTTNENSSRRSAEKSKLEGFPYSTTTPDLLAYYPFESIEGQTVRDRTNYEHPGTIHGASIDAHGIAQSKALEFDGKGDYVELQLQDIASITSSSHSYSFWFKVKKGAIPSEEPDNFPFGLGGNEISPDEQNKFRLGKNFFEYRTGKDRSHAVVKWNFEVPRDNKWHHFVLVATGGGNTPQKWNLYLDSQKISNKSVREDSWEDPGAKFVHKPYLGAQNEEGPYAFYEGSLDEFRVYSRGLSSSQVKEIYRSGTK